MKRHPKLLRIELIDDRDQIVARTGLFRIPRKHNRFLDSQRARIHFALDVLLSEGRPAIKDWLK